MIRLANRSDLNVVASLIIEFLSSTSYNNHCSDIDHEHIKKLVYAMLQSGRVWLYELNNVSVGLLVAVKEQNVWMPTKYSLRELVWYVREEHRRSAGAGRLFVHFCRDAEKMLNNGEIEGYFTTRMSTTEDYDLESRGFRLTEKLYLKDN